MLIKSTLLVLAIFSTSTTVQASEKLLLPALAIELKTSNVMEKMDNVLLNPENMLKRYRPTGAKITNKSVVHSQVQFNAEKTVYLYTKNVFIKGYFSVVKNNLCQTPAETGYSARLDLYGSDMIITDNIERYTAQICVRQLSSDRAYVKVNAALFKGPNYSLIVGPIISDIISAQTSAFVEAITDEIKSIR